jgi:hypothetical protein
MEKYEMIERQSWACIAEAVAHYYLLGFKTSEESDNERIMLDTTGKEVRIVKHGLLDVRSSMIQRV